MQNKYSCILEDLNIKISDRLCSIISLIRRTLLSSGITVKNLEHFGFPGKC